MIKTIQKYLAVALIMVQLPVIAQNRPETSKENEKSRKAWEFGLGGSLINLDRVSFNNFRLVEENYKYNLDVRHLMGGANLYIARELSPWFYLDFQGTMGMARSNNPEGGKRNMNFLYLGGLGLQWRLSPLFKSKYVEPYLRVGGNILHKEFQTAYSGDFKNDPTGEAMWQSNDTWNPNGRSNDKKTYFPLSLGAGVNAWLNNSLGLGLQAEYLMPLRKSLPHFAQISVRVMWRFGGSDKRPKPVIHYVEIEKPVEKIVERVIEKVVPTADTLSVFELLDNVNFEFDKYVLTAESEIILDKAAQLLKQFKNEHFLITGFTDAKGSDSYNLRLSRNRARVVMESLEKRGVSSDMLKSRGVGKRAVAVGANETNEVRWGDRKVTIERVNQPQYWNKLPKTDSE